MTDLQKALNEVYAFLKAQGRRSVRVDEIGKVRCVYRSSDGTKCAAGFFMSDDDYHPIMEGRRASTIPNSHAIFNGLPPDFLDACQNAHDRCDAVSSFQETLRSEFRNVASRFNLTLAE